MLLTRTDLLATMDALEARSVPTKRVPADQHAIARSHAATAIEDALPPFLGDHDALERANAWRFKIVALEPDQLEAVAEEVYPGLAKSVLRERPGDQPLPTANDQPAVQDAVLAYLEERKALGLRRYGTLLQPNNGRDALRDAFEEAADLLNYLAQAMIERDGQLPNGDPEADVQHLPG